MGNTATNVTTGKPKVSGAVFVAPKGTTVPNDATSKLPAAFVCLGYVSENGLSNANEMDVSSIKVWGGSIVYRSLSELNDAFSLALVESENVDVLKAVYGSQNVTQDAHGNISVDVKIEDPEERVWVFELALRGDKAKRMVIPDGAITARETITYNDSDAVAYGITVSAYPDANGITHHEYIEGDPYTVSFNSNGGSAVPSQTVHVGGKATQPANPTKADATFAGWYSDAALTTAYNFNTVVTSSMTLYAKWTEIDSPTVAPESGAATLFDTLVSDMQENVVVSDGAITGTLHFIEGGIASSGPLAGDGHFIALKFTDLDPDATSVKVGLEPSQETGLVELINDPDKNGVFKVTDTNQVFKVVSSNGTLITTDTYSLSGLVLEEA